MAAKRSFISKQDIKERTRLKASGSNSFKRLLAQTALEGFWLQNGFVCMLYDIDVEG